MPRMAFQMAQALRMTKADKSKTNGRNTHMKEILSTGELSRDMKCT